MHFLKYSLTGFVCALSGFAVFAVLHAFQSTVGMLASAFVVAVACVVIGIMRCRKFIESNGEEGCIVYQNWMHLLVACLPFVIFFFRANPNRAVAGLLLAAVLCAFFFCGVQAHRLNSKKDVLISFLTQISFPFIVICGYLLIIILTAKRSADKKKLMDFDIKGDAKGKRNYLDEIEESNARASSMRGFLSAGFTTLVAMPVLLMMQEDVRQYIDKRLTREPEFEWPAIAGLLIVSGGLFFISIRTTSHTGTQPKMSLAKELERIEHEPAPVLNDCDEYEGVKEALWEEEKEFISTGLRERGVEGLDSKRFTVQAQEVADSRNASRFKCEGRINILSDDDVTRLLSYHIAYSLSIDEGKVTVYSEETERSRPDSDLRETAGESNSGGKNINYCEYGRVREILFDAEKAFLKWQMQTRGLDNIPGKRFTIQATEAADSMGGPHFKCKGKASVRSEDDFTQFLAYDILYSMDIDLERVTFYPEKTARSNIQSFFSASKSEMPATATRQPEPIVLVPVQTVQQSDSVSTKSPSVSAEQASSPAQSQRPVTPSQAREKQTRNNTTQPMDKPKQQAQEQTHQHKPRTLKDVFQALKSVRREAPTEINPTD